MTERKPNQVARALAVLALLGAFVLVVATIATSGGGDGDEGGSDSGKAGESSGPTREGRRALEQGVWVVREGDTLVAISEATGIDLDELVELNPDIDPQALTSGQRISLRAGSASGGEQATTTTAPGGSDPADEFGDGSVDGDGSGSDGLSP